MEPVMAPAPLYAARIEDLQFAPTVGSECLECGHKGEIPVELIAAKLPEWYRVLDIYRIVRCEKCGAKGRAIIDARRALGNVP
jgi:uncharacterized Zn finger protein